MFARSAVAVALAVSLVSAATAAGAPPWSAPRDVLASTSQLVDPTIAFAAAGQATVLVDALGRPETAQQLVGTVAGGLGAAGTLPGRVSGPAATYGHDGYAVLRLQPRAAERGGTGVRLRIGVARGHGGRLGSTQEIATYATQFGDGGRPSLASDRAGAMAVAYVQRRRPGSYALLVATRPAAGRFGTPRVVRASHSFIGAPRVAIGRGGDLLVAYHRGTVVEARVQRRGHGMGAVERLGSASASVSVEVVAAIGSNGRMFVAWRGRTPAVVRAASRAAGSQRFARSVVLDPGAGAVRVPGTLALGLAPAGGATIVWSRPATSGGLPVYVVRTATATPDGRFAAPVDVPGASGAAAAIDYDARGGMLVTWIQDVAGGEVLAAAARPAGGAFSAPEAVSGVEPAIGGAASAIDPLTGAAVGVWIADPVALSPLVRTTQLLRVATRPGR